MSRPISARQKAHAEGLQALQTGAYDKALHILREGLETHGPHVGLLADTAGAAYLKGDMGAFQLFVERLEHEFKISFDLLSVESRIRTRITLAKFFEELGRIADAFDQIDETLGELPAGHDLSFPARAQKLRLLASFGKEADVGELYRLCLQISQENANAWIECFHALILAEVRLFGFAMTWPRLEELLESPLLQQADPRLLIFDLLEAALEKNDNETRMRLLDLIESKGLTDFDSYETALLQIANPEGRAMTADDVFQWTRKISPLGTLRLLLLELQIKPVAANKTKLREQVLFRMHSFDARSRRLLLFKWSGILKADRDLALQLDPAHQVLARQEYRVSFRNSPQSWLLLQALIDSPAASPTDLHRQLTGRQEASLQDLETLRIGLLRLERKLRKGLHLDWVFKYAKDGIQRNPALRFEKPSKV